MSMSDHFPIILHANKEHSSVRFTVILVLASAFVASFLGLNVILSSLDSAVASYALALSCILALPAALGFAALAESLLKKSWPSGQKLVLREDGIDALLVDGGQAHIDWSARFTVLKWYFGIKGYARGGRERRVPSNYFCLALQLQQDDDRFVVHSYLPQAAVEAIIDGKGYSMIQPSQFARGGFIRRWAGSTDRPKIPAGVLAGREGPYWLAERRRWDKGLELEKDDLKTFLTILEEKFTVWDDLG